MTALIISGAAVIFSVSSLYYAARAIETTQAFAHILIQSGLVEVKYEEEDE